jgi:hypothetical protein
VKNVKAKAMRLDLRKPLLFMIALAVATVFTLTALAEKNNNIKPAKILENKQVMLDSREVASVKKISGMLDDFFLKMDKQFAKLKAVETAQINFETN